MEKEFELNLDFDNYSVEEMMKIREKLYDSMNELTDRIESQKLGEYDFTGKYVKCDRGMMLVTWQTNEGNSMFFQGLTFTSKLGKYRDDSYLSYDALGEWRIPMSTFKIDVQNNEFKEITKEEFITTAKENFEKAFGEFTEWVEYIENDLKTQQE